MMIGVLPGRANKTTDVSERFSTMKHHICLLLTRAVVLAGLFASPLGAQIYYGDNVAFGDGWLRTYVRYDSGVPARLGVQMNQSAFNAFATAEETASVLSLPSQVPAPFNHVMLDWNPHGHPGPGYNVPHFDFHFYLTSPEEVAAIPFGLNPTPMDPAYVAPNYTPDRVVIAQMGQHYFDLLAPEFNGGAFTDTFIYGYYQGNMTFLEQMITYETMESGEPNIFAVRQPSHFQLGGYYPTEYGFSNDNGVYDVFIGGLAFTAASPVPEPSTYGAAAGFVLVGLAALRRTRKARVRLGT